MSRTQYALKNLAMRTQECRFLVAITEQELQILDGACDLAKMDLAQALSQLDLERDGLHLEDLNDSHKILLEQNQLLRENLQGRVRELEETFSLISERARQWDQWVEEA